jgi:hypothetical protein
MLRCLVISSWTPLVQFRELDIGSVIYYDMGNKHLTSRGSKQTRCRNLEPSTIEQRHSPSRQTSKQDKFPNAAWLMIRRISKIQCDRYIGHNVTTKNVADGKVILLCHHHPVNILRIADRYPYLAYFTDALNTGCSFYPFVPKIRPDTNVRNVSPTKNKYIERRTADNLSQSRNADSHPLGPNCFSDGCNCRHSGKGIASRQLISTSVRS